MISFTKRNILVYTFIISIIIYIVLITIFDLIKENILDSFIQTQEPNIEIIELVQANIVGDGALDVPVLSYSAQTIWKLEIPKIALNAPIKEGTSQEIIAQTIGHFTETPMFEGNVGLASHNRGSSGKYFERIKELEIGDKIIYYTEQGSREYEVIESCIIIETDWTYLEPSDDNKLTLITCVENMPEYRRCVIAKEISKNIEQEDLENSRVDIVRQNTPLADIKHIC